MKLENFNHWRIGCDDAYSGFNAIAPLFLGGSWSSALKVPSDFCIACVQGGDVCYTWANLCIFAHAKFSYFKALLEIHIWNRWSPYPQIIDTRIPFLFSCEILQSESQQPHSNRPNLDWIYRKNYRGSPAPFLIVVSIKYQKDEMPWILLNSTSYVPLEMPC